MPERSVAPSRAAVALRWTGAIATTLVVAGGALGDTTFTYDAAGHLLAVRDPATDPEACGIPPVSCAPDPHGVPICSDGGCSVRCDPGWTDVGRQCVETASNPLACGAGLAVCAVPVHGEAICVQGQCGASCEPGFVAAGSECVLLSDDPRHCGEIGQSCRDVPGYVACCSASTCGASDGAACVNVTTDPSNCGWIGHVCTPAGGSAASCSSGRCAKPAGTPRVDRVNGASASAAVFRSPFWSGLSLTGANLDLVTWVELEDWGADTVDGTPDGVQSVPTSRQVTLPTGSRGPTIHFRQSSSTLDVDAESLEFQGAFDPRFETRHWLKVRVHYTSNGRDRSILADVAVSLTDLVSQGLPQPTIDGVARYEALLATGYDPATGLLSTAFDDPTSFPVRPTAVMSSSLQREFPVLAVAPEGIYVAKGLDPRQLGTRDWSGFLEALVVYPYEPGGSPALIVPSTNLIVRGSNLWDDGPLQFLDANGDPAAAGVQVGAFMGDRVVISAPVLVETRAAFLQFASMRGAARSPMLEFAGTPSVSRIEWGAGWEDLDSTTGCYNCFDSRLPLFEVVTLSGRWLGKVDRVTYEGPASTWEPYSPRLAEEPLTRVDHTPGPSEFRVLDDEHLELRIDANPARDRAHRVRVLHCDCAGCNGAGSSVCYDYGLMNSHSRRITLVDSANGLGDRYELNPGVGQVQVMADCGPVPLGIGEPEGLPWDPPAPGPGDCSNSICP